MPRSNMEDLAVHVERIAATIGRQPVLGHWPHMKAELDQRILVLAAGALRDLSRQLVAVSELGHKLMADETLCDPRPGGCFELKGHDGPHNAMPTQQR